MFNLYQLVTGAQGGQGLDALAGRFGLTREEADRGVRALLPALSTAFLARAAQPHGLMGLAGAMNEHRAAYGDPAAAQDPQLQDSGAAVTGSLFGNDAVLAHVTRTAAQFTGLPEATLRGMLPTVTSMALGGAAEAMHAQGMGGMLGELAEGGLGGVLGHVGGPGAFGGGMLGGSQAGFGGMLGSIMSSFFGGTGQPTEAGYGAGQPGADSVRPGDPASALPPMVQAGIDQLFKMFQPGTAGAPGAAGHPFGDLSGMLGGVFGRH